MKIRQGFVSNSSSSSFIFDKNLYSQERITKFIEELVIAYNTITRNETTLGDICVIKEETSKQFINSATNYYEREIDDLKLKGPLVVVDSTGDNSIPSFIQDALEAYAIRRFHWG